MINIKSYAGIGSRNLPENVEKVFISLGKFFGSKGIALRSGGASGADQAFERGCDMSDGRKEIYLPWYRFEDSNSKLIVSNPKAFEIGEKYHPYWHNLKQGARKLQARNSHQVLGLDLETPCDFIMCYTKNGKGSGGTGQALRIAKDYNIPVFDAGLYENDIKQLKLEINKFIKSLK